MEQTKEQKDALYWANVAKLAQESNSRKVSVELLRELQNRNDQLNNRNALHF
jgi:hypothetical protein